MHPNEEIKNDHPNESGEGGCGGRFADFDEKHMKPFFIHEYSPELIAKANAFDDEVIRNRQKDKIIDLIGQNFKAQFSNSIKANLAKNLMAKSSVE